jgi:tRNA-2-methylthio-N6-dimethylallyladenosine synthase
LISDIGYAQAYSFKYSARPGTPAAAEDSHVAEAVKEDRLATVQQLLRAQQTAFNEAYRGARMSVLFDRPGRHPGQLAGRTQYLQAVHADAPTRLIGAVVDCDIVDIRTTSLKGVVDIVEPDHNQPSQDRLGPQTERAIA